MLAAAECKIRPLRRQKEGRTKITGNAAGVSALLFVTPLPPLHAFVIRGLFATSYSSDEQEVLKSMIWMQKRPLPANVVLGLTLL